MKRVYITLLVSLFLGSVMGQQFNQNPAPQKSNYSLVKVKTPLHHSDSKVAGDTVGFTSNYLPTFVYENMTAFALSKEGVGNVGYWWGTNYGTTDTATDVWIQCYLNNGIDLPVVSGIGFYCAYKNIVSGNEQNDTVVFYLNKLLEHGCLTEYTDGNPPDRVWSAGPKAYMSSPEQNSTDGTRLGYTYITADQIDTAWVNDAPVFNYLSFGDPITINVPDTSPNGFAICVNFHQPRVNGDTIIFYCDNQGDGQQLRLSQGSAIIPDGSSYYLPMSNFFKYNGEDGGLDNNGALFAVLASGAGIDARDYFQGMKLSVRNNPVKDIAVFDYALQNNSNVLFEIYDIKGRLVKKVKEGNKAAGQYSVSFNTNDMGAGEYFYILTANGNRLAKKMIISK